MPSRPCIRCGRLVRSGSYCPAHRPRYPGSRRTHLGTWRSASGHSSAVLGRGLGVERAAQPLEGLLDGLPSGVQVTTRLVMASSTRTPAGGW